MPELPAPGWSDPALVVLVGTSGAGKSTWAAERYRNAEIVSSDQLRGVVGSGPNDLDASADAFALLGVIVRARAARKLTTVIDTLGLDRARRQEYLELARSAGLRAVVVVFQTPAALSRARNSARDRPVPAAVLTGQHKRLRGATAEISTEGWDQQIMVTGAAVAPTSEPVTEPELPTPAAREMDFVLQLSRFPWGVDPAGWLAGIARSAADAGFSGIALMDHLIQIPVVGRAWEPIPEPWVTLGLLAGLDLGLRLGTLVSPITFRAPGIIAKAAATLDVLTGGRAFCGLGAGWWQREHAAFGLPFPSARQRLDQLELTIETVRALWSPGTRKYCGQRLELPETTCYPRPVGRIPIIVGGSGERRTLQIAARYGDGCNLSSDPEVLAGKVEVLRRHCAQALRDPAEVAVTVLDVPIIGADRDEVAERIERLRGRSAATTLVRRAGPPADHVARYRRLAGLGVSTVFLAPAELRGPADVAQFAPVVQAFD